MKGRECDSKIVRIAQAGEWDPRVPSQKVYSNGRRRKIEREGLLLDEPQGHPPDFFVCASVSHPAQRQKRVSDRYLAS